uniref:Large ribosomal subunit protein bL20c n=1 Tax=Hemionitis ludens TaxID=377232 RepID=A0A3G5CT10_HEMLU|nr:ribosomal protein L20 [Calciphilopteris ludens]AYW16010.1 ribosomal protein L20 [Calciphilopteris ludens]
MTRVKRGSVARKYRKNILDFTSGFRGAHSRLFRMAKQRREKALSCAYVDRNNRKRAFRCLWIARINAAARRDGITHSSVIHSFYENRVSLNRKTLAQIAIADAYCFSMLVRKVSDNRN